MAGGWSGGEDVFSGPVAPGARLRPRWTGECARPHMSCAVFEGYGDELGK